VQRALLGRADRDVVEGAAVGVAGRDAKATGMAKACTRSWGGSAKSQAIVLNARCMRDERRLAGR
jgi:hypothetical protein